MKLFSRNKSFGITRGAKLAELGVWSESSSPLVRLTIRYVGPWGEGEEISATYCFIPIESKTFWQSLDIPLPIVELLVGSRRATKGNFSFEFLFGDNTSKQLTLSLDKVHTLYRGRGTGPKPLLHIEPARSVAPKAYASLDGPELLKKDEELKEQAAKEKAERERQLAEQKKAELEARKQAQAKATAGAPAAASAGAAPAAAFDAGGAKVGLFYGSTTGNTAGIGDQIKAQLGDAACKVVNVTDVPASALNAFECLILGVPTWHIGEMQEDWAEYLTKLDGLDLKGKKIAIFGLGDGVGYPDTYVDAMEELWRNFKPLGAELVGLWPTEGYPFEKSKAILDGKFMGLVIDIENQNDLSDERIKKWTAQIKGELGL